MTGFLIRLLRESHGLSAGQLAARASVRQSSLEAIEAGTKQPTTREAHNLARALNVPLDRLIAQPTPGLDTLPEWQRLTEAMYQHGLRFGWKEAAKYLVTITHALGREHARLKMMARAR